MGAGGGTGDSWAHGRSRREQAGRQAGRWAGRRAPPPARHPTPPPLASRRTSPPAPRTQSPVPPPRRCRGWGLRGNAPRPVPPSQRPAKQGGGEGKQRDLGCWAASLSTVFPWVVETDVASLAQCHQPSPAQPGSAPPPVALLPHTPPHVHDPPQLGKPPAQPSPAPHLQLVSRPLALLLVHPVQLVAQDLWCHKFEGWRSMGEKGMACRGSFPDGHAVESCRVAHVLLF